MVVLLLVLAFAFRETIHRWTGVSRQGLVAPAATQSNLPGKTVVWLNKRNKKYHCPDSPWYGKTLDGEYITQEKAVADGFGAAYGKPCR